MDNKTLQAILQLTHEFSKLINNRSLSNGSTSLAQVSKVLKFVQDYQELPAKVVFYQTETHIRLSCPTSLASLDANQSCKTWSFPESCNVTVFKLVRSTEHFGYVIDESLPLVEYAKRRISKGVANV